MNLDNIGMADWKRAAMAIGVSFLVFAVLRAWFDPGVK